MNETNREDAPSSRYVPDDPSLWEQMATTFRGSQRGWTILFFSEGVVLTVLAVVTAVRFFQADTVRLQIGYAASFLFMIQIVVLIKVFFWMMMNRNEVLRRVSRLERKIDRILGEVGSAGSPRA